MKEKKPTRDRWLTLRLSKNEEANLLKLCRKTSCRSTSEYARAVLLKKPVVLLYRNASADDFLEEMLCLKKELKAIGNTFQQTVSLLQASGNTSDVKLWIARTEGQRTRLLKTTDAILQKAAQIHLLWSQK